MTKVISFLNEKGGCGKTTSLLEVAFKLGLTGAKVLVADLDPQANATAMLTGSAKHKPGLYDLMVDEDEEIEPTAVLRAAGESWQNVLVLPADRRLGSLDTALQSRVARDQILKAILSKFRQHVNYILIDLPPALSTATVNALVASNFYLIPADRSEYSREAIPAIEKLAALIRKSQNPELECLGIFMTGFEKGGALAVRALLDDLEKEFQGKMLPIRIAHSVKVLESQRLKKPVGIIAPECSVSEAYGQLAEIITGA